ncbi:MAG: hypothetical protein K2G96_02060 [Clostridia bacterium]|nr:hypothetical protein [Clostridia bacterium]
MNKDDKEKLPAPSLYTGKAYAYIAVALLIAGAVALGLIFTKLGIYALIAAVLFQLGALSFANVQKKKNNFKYLKIIMICSYVLLGVSVLLFIGGIIYASSTN